MISTKKPFHPLGENTKHKTQKTTTSPLYTTKPYCVYEHFKLQTVLYKLSSTNELLTARIGLLATAHTIDQHFPALGSNCALKASTFINTLTLSQPEGGQCLDDTATVSKTRRYA